jgi:hypothetical protein
MALVGIATKSTEAAVSEPAWGTKVRLGPESLVGGSVVAIGRIADIARTWRFGSE